MMDNEVIIMQITKSFTAAVPATLRSQTAKAWCSNVEFRCLSRTEEKLTEKRYDRRDETSLFRVCERWIRILKKPDKNTNWNLW